LDALAGDDEFKLREKINLARLEWLDSESAIPNEKKMT